MIRALPTRRSATSAAEHALRDAIVSGELAPGDRLPPERVLSKQLGISRLTLRSALATLSAAGLIAVRHGSGYTVRDLRDSGGTDLLPGLVDTGSSAERGAAAADLLRLRRHLAAAVLEAIAERPPTAARRRGVHVAIDRFADASAELHAARAVGAANPSSAAVLRAAELAIVDADLGVVRALLDAGGSLVLRVCLNPIIAVLRDSAPLREAIYAKPETNLIGWRALGVWIDKPDAASIPVLLGVLAARDHTTIETLRKGPR
jgi:DNA-binding FadR family transcriptional regulator